MALFAARYCREPQALELSVQFRQAVGLVVNVVLVARFQAFPAELHEEELNQVGEVHFQEVVLLEILEFGTDAQEFDAPASLVAPEPLCLVRAQLGRLSFVWGRVFIACDREC